MIEINNRRYIGSKTKLLKNIEQSIEEYDLPKNYVFADLFAGTGVVGYDFASSGKQVIVNDILYSNYISYRAWFSEEEIDIDKIKKILDGYNNIVPDMLQPNYFSRVYGDKYYSIDDAKKIGYIRDDIEKIKSKLNDREYYYILTSLIYYADKIANTVGHFESFLKRKPQNTTFEMDLLNIKKINNSQIYKMDANILVRQIEADVVYIDPPYNARQYINFYHVLENLAVWNKPTEFEGVSMKFKRDYLKSGYSQSRAPILFEDLISNLKCKLIIVSYNNTYSARSTASNNKISQEEIMRILSNKGKTKVIDIPYRSFNTGKTSLKNHKEYIFVCEVK